MNICTAPEHPPLGERSSRPSNELIAVFFRLILLAFLFFALLYLGSSPYSLTTHYWRPWFSSATGRTCGLLHDVAKKTQLVHVLYTVSMDIANHTLALLCKVTESNEIVMFTVETGSTEGVVTFLTEEKATLLSMKDYSAAILCPNLLDRPGK